MATRKEILNRKDEWLEALLKIVEVYKAILETGSAEVFRKTDCALCVLADKIRMTLDKHMEKADCDFCIHKSTFSYNKACVYQHTFINILNMDAYDDPSFDDLENVKARIKVIEEIFAKLQNAES